MTAVHTLMLISILGADPLGAGDHSRTLMMGEQKQTFLVYVPK